MFCRGLFLALTWKEQIPEFEPVAPAPAAFISGANELHVSRFGLQEGSRLHSPASPPYAITSPARWAASAKILAFNLYHGLPSGLPTEQA